MSIPNQFEEPRVRSIDVILKPGFGEDDLRALATTVISNSDFVLRRVPLEPTGLEWDLVLLFPAHPSEAWDLAHRLGASHCVSTAEPNFEARYAEEEPSQEVTETQVPQAFEELGSAKYDENQCDWSIQLIEAEQAWQHPESVARQGAGIRIGHPDSGYRTHPELGIGQNFKQEEGWDFIENDAFTENDGGGHGLSTASVISSPDNRREAAATGGKKTVTGVAPRAEVIPLRVAKPTWFIPAPVLFNVGVERLRDAIWFAIHRRVHVISISLGWLPNQGLHRAIQHAVRENIIVVAAAGNYTGPLVVWPAAYNEVIAMAACNARREPWTWSARGAAVDATGPGENVWTAQPGGKVKKSSGTSHATATVAGIAALWLAHHGRDRLLDMYKDGPPLSEVFRHVLRTSCDPWSEDSRCWGAGLVNARACLEQELPARQTILESFGGGPAIAKAQTDTARDAFASVPESEFYERLAGVLAIAPTEATRLDAEFGRELRFLALTQPQLRRTLLEETPTIFEEFGGNTGPAVSPMSSALRTRLESIRNAP